MNPEREPKRASSPETGDGGGTTISELGTAQIEALEKLNKERAEKNISDEEYNKRLAKLLDQALEFSKKAEAPASELEKKEKNSP